MCRRSLSTFGGRTGYGTVRNLSLIRKKKVVLTFTTTGSQQYYGVGELRSVGTKERWHSLRSVGTDRNLSSTTDSHEHAACRDPLRVDMPFGRCRWVHTGHAVGDADQCIPGAARMCLRTELYLSVCGCSAPSAASMSATTAPNEPSKTPPSPYSSRAAFALRTSVMRCCPRAPNRLYIGLGRRYVQPDGYGGAGYTEARPRG